MITSRYGRKLLATAPAPYRSPPGPGSPRVSGEPPRAFRPPGLEEVSEAVSKQSPESRSSLFRDSGDCLETASNTFWPGRPRRLSERLFGVPGPKGPGDSCKGQGGCKKWRFNGNSDPRLNRNRLSDMSANAQRTPSEHTTENWTDMILLGQPYKTQSGKQP